MQHYVSDICTDALNSDDIVDAIMYWVSQNEERVPHFEDLLNKVKLNKCSVEGIQAIMKTHESLLDKAPTAVYKLLLSTVVKIAAVTSRVSTDTRVVCSWCRKGLTSLMAKWLEQASQLHGIYCHNLEVMSSNPG